MGSEKPCSECGTLLSDPEALIESVGERWHTSARCLRVQNARLRAALESVLDRLDDAIEKQCERWSGDGTPERYSRSGLRFAQSLIEDERAALSPPSPESGGRDE